MPSTTPLADHGAPASRAAELVAELHANLDELQTVDLSSCTDEELIDVAAETERAIARLTVAGDRQINQAVARDLPVACDLLGVCLAAGMPVEGALEAVGLTGPANVLVVPARHSASISVKLMQEMAGATVIGPILTGVPKPVQICGTGSTVNDILNMAAMAAGRVGQVA